MEDRGDYEEHLQGNGEVDPFGGEQARGRDALTPSRRRSLSATRSRRMNRRMASERNVSSVSRSASSDSGSSISRHAPEPSRSALTSGVMDSHDDYDEAHSSLSRLTGLNDVSTQNKSPRRNSKGGLGKGSNHGRSSRALGQGSNHGKSSRRLSKGGLDKGSGHSKSSRRLSKGSLDKGSGHSTSSRNLRGASSKRMPKRGGKRADVTSTSNAEQELNQKLSSLQLPNMPGHFLSSEGTSRATMGVGASQDPPTIRILIVADIDLESASALAESALTGQSTASNNMYAEENPLQRVDLCIACGPFCQDDEDLRNYYEGRQRRRHISRHSTTTHGWPSMSSSAAPIWNQRGGGAQPNELLPLSTPSSQSNNIYSNFSSNRRRSRQNGILSNNMGYGRGKESSSTAPSSAYPLPRSREETAAMEGLMTAALSQLEAIVCRVVYVPGKTDPVTTITSHPTSISYTRERRLTPNSRNIHQHWMPLSPGLGCAGLLYVDGGRLLQQPPPLEDDEDDDDDDDLDDLDDIDDQDSETSSLAERSGSRRRHRNSFANQPSSSFRHSESNGNNPNDSFSIQEASSQPPPLTSAAYVERAKEYGTEFCSQLEKLVDLAPPVPSMSETPPTHAQTTSLQETERFQSILVTQFHHLEKDLVLDGSLSTSANFKNPLDPNQHNSRMSSMTSLLSEEDQLYLEGVSDDEEECFDPPWPLEHEGFCAKSFIQEHVLLEIAAGTNSKGHTVRPMEVPKGPMKVVLPGSLRERGEFCLVDVAFTKNPFAAASAKPKSGSSKGDYRWRVRRTRFQTISDYV